MEIKLIINTLVKGILKGIYSALISFVSIFGTIFNKTRQKKYFLVNIFNLKNIFLLNILYILLKIMVEKRER